LTDPTRRVEGVVITSGERTRVELEE
jgi:hypothetical protein